MTQTAKSVKEYHGHTETLAHCKNTNSDTEKHIKMHSSQIIHLTFKIHKYSKKFKKLAIID